MAFVEHPGRSGLPPNLDEVLIILADIMDTDAVLNGSTPISELGMDSLDVLEFLFRTGLDSEIVLEDESVFADIADKTIAELYAQLVAVAGVGR